MKKLLGQGVKGTATRTARNLCFLMLCITGFAMSGCESIAVTGQPLRAYQPSVLPRAQVVLYLNGPEKASQNISFTLASAALVGDDGMTRELLSVPYEANSLDLVNRQVLLAEHAVAEGKFRQLRLKIERATLRRQGRAADLVMRDEAIVIPVDLTVETAGSVPIFLTWNSDASVPDGFTFSPVFVVSSKTSQLRSLLVYVTNEASHYVSVINRQTDEVVDTILVGKRPRGVTVNERRSRLKVYVANAESNSLSVINPNANVVESEVPLRFGKEPVDVAVAPLRFGRDLLFVANTVSNNVAVIDADSLQEIDRIDVGSGPVAVEADPSSQRPLDTRYLSAEDRDVMQSYRDRFLNVYVANRHSKSVTVIRVNVLNGRVEDVTAIEADWEPVALSVDYERGRLYVVNHGSDVLSMIYLPDLIRGLGKAAVRPITNVGFGGTDMVADPGFDRLYLLKDSGEIDIMRVSWDRGSMQRSQIPTMMGSIAVGKRPGAILFDPEARKIYVLNRESNTVSVIDKTTRRLEKSIPVGVYPAGIAMFSE